MSTPAASATRSSSDRSWAWATWGLLSLFVALVFATYGRYGITYDEAFHVQHGQSVAAWYASGFRDQSFLELKDLREYGAIFDLSAEYLHLLTGMDVYDLRHVLSGLCGAAAIAALASIARLLVGSEAGYWTAFLALTTPRFFGHAFVNPVDIPFAAAYLWAIDALVRLTLVLPALPPWRLAQVGLTFGMALAVRFGGALLFGYLVFAFAAWLFLASRRGELAVPRARRTAARRYMKAVVTVGIIAAVVVVPFYPWFQLSPIMNPLRAVFRPVVGSEGVFGVFAILHQGELVRNDALPRSYVWFWLTHELPEAYSIALPAAAAALIAWWRQVDRGAMLEPKSLAWSVVVLAAFGPLLGATIGRPVLHDGIRHFLFSTLLLAVIGGVGIAYLLSAERPRSLRYVSGVAMALAVGITFVDMVRLHPYESVYFNRLVAGGLGATEGYEENDYWGFSLREGAEWLNRHGSVEGRRLRVASSSHPEQTTRFLDRSGFEYIGSVDEGPSLVNRTAANPPDYYITTTRWNRHLRYPGKVIHRVERDGVTLTMVVQVDREAASRR